MECPLDDRLPDADPDENVSSLGFNQHPPLVLRVVRVRLAEIIPDDLPRSVLLGIAEFPSEFGRFICSHNSECRPWPDHVRGDDRWL